MNIEEEISQAAQRHQAGQLAEAAAMYQRILRADPANAHVLNLMGIVACQLGRPAEASGFLRKAIEILPGSGEIHHNLALAFLAGNQRDLAEAALRKATALSPSNAGAWSQLGDVLFLSGKLAEAETACRKAMELNGKLFNPLNTLGHILLQINDVDGAIAVYRLAAERFPQDSRALCNLGQVLSEVGCRDESIKCLQTAAALNPQSAEAHWNLGLMLLRQGKLTEGWPEFEWRWKLPSLPATYPYRQPLWDGNELHGRRILLHTEQGMGDTIQFMRYVPMVLARGGRISVAPQPELLPLLKCIEGVERWLKLGEVIGPMDVQCPVMSLPGRLGTTIETIPANIPYLKAAPDLVKKWRARMPSDNRRKIGLAWAGGGNPPGRALPAEQLKILKDIPNLWFCSLQKSAAPGASPGPPLEIVDWSDELHDFADTAALIDNLDLVLTVDTAVGHLAGAMGKPVWVLLKFVADWRWRIEGETTPWYPTMRLFRQEKRGDWSAPLAKAAQAMRRL